MVWQRGRLMACGSVHVALRAVAVSVLCVSANVSMGMSAARFSALPRLLFTCNLKKKP